MRRVALKSKRYDETFIPQNIFGVWKGQYKVFEIHPAKFYAEKQPVKSGARWVTL